MNKKFSLILFLALAFVLVLAALLLMRMPILAGDWDGAPPIETTTPTTVLWPADGWWNDLPTPADNSSPLP